MFCFCSRKFVHLQWCGVSSTRLFFIRNSSFRFTSDAIGIPSPTVDYLIKRCGLTQESALKASQRINIKSTTKADEVLAILGSYGLLKPYISDLVRKDPGILSVDPKKILVKLEFFSDMGISGPNLSKIFCRDASLLMGASLENQIVPSMDFLKSFVDDKDIAVVLSRLRWVKGIQRVMEPNIETLRNLGVPYSGISKLIMRRPQLLTWKQPQFNEVVQKTKEMGFDPSSLMFIHAVCSLSQMTEATLETKMDVFRSFGWSDEEILFLFRKQPSCLCRSEELLRMRLDFFMNKMNLTPAEVGRNPVVLLLSLEKRTIPRYSVLQILLSQGLIKRQSIGSALISTEETFLENYVRKYHQKLPNLLNEYRRNMK